MRPYLEDNLRASGWPQERFSWVQGSAEAMPLADASMDAVVCTLVSGRGQAACMLRLPACLCLIFCPPALPVVWPCFLALLSCLSGPPCLLSCPAFLSV
jgi:hypothetical protein